jgi:NADH dehydrogenase
MREGITASRNAGKKIVVVVGAGFGGLNAAKELAGCPDLFVVLIDQRNHHLFQPLLYQVATAGLNPADIAVPIRSEFSNIDNVQVHMARVKTVDLNARRVSGSEGEIDYDFLVLACGAQDSYFGHPEWEQFAPGLKTLEQATGIRRRILTAFELAENERDPVHQAALMTFVVVGGGATGVELAGAIADISRTVLVNDFKRINSSNAKVILVEAGPRLLAAFDPQLSDRTARDLAQLGVEVRLAQGVQHVDAGGVKIGNEFVAAKSVFWAAGVQATRLDMTPVLDMDRAGRIKVGEDLSVPGHPDAFVIGDMAAVENGPGKLVPGVAPAALQEGKYVAKTIKASIAGRPRGAFAYHDKGQLATIGHQKAVMELGPLKIGGRLAWLAWLFVHVFYLIGFRNRVLVMSQWAWNYIFSKRGARLITEADRSRC